MRHRDLPALVGPEAKHVFDVTRQIRTAASMFFIVFGDFIFAPSNYFLNWSIQTVFVFSARVIFWCRSEVRISVATAETMVLVLDDAVATVLTFRWKGDRVDLIG